MSRTKAPDAQQMTKKLILKDAVTTYVYGENNKVGDGAYCDVYAPLKPEGSGEDISAVAIKILRGTDFDLETEFLQVGEQSKRITHPHFMAPLDYGKGKDENGTDVFYWILEPGEQTVGKLITEKLAELNAAARKTAIMDNEWVRQSYYLLLNGLVVVDEIGKVWTSPETRYMDVKKGNMIIMKKKDGLASFKIADPKPLSKQTRTMYEEEGQNENLGFSRVLEIAYTLLTGKYRIDSRIHMQQINPTVSQHLMDVIVNAWTDEKQGSIDDCINACKKAIEKDTGGDSTFESSVPYFGVVHENGIYHVLGAVDYFKKVIEGCPPPEIPQVATRQAIKDCYDGIKKRRELMDETKTMLDGRGIRQEEEMQPIVGYSDAEKAELTSKYESIKKMAKENRQPDISKRKEEIIEEEKENENIIKNNPVNQESETSGG